MKKTKRKFKKQNKTIKINKNSLSYKIKKNFFIDGHMHYLFPNNATNILLGKPDNKGYEQLPNENNHKKYMSLIQKTNWKPDGIVACNIQPTDVMYKIKETADILKEAKKNKLIKGFMAAIPVYMGKIGVDTFFDGLKNYKSNLDLNLIKIARLDLTSESICSVDNKNFDSKLFEEGLNELGKRNILWKWNSADTNWSTVNKLTKKCKNTKFIVDHLLLTTDEGRLSYKKWRKQMVHLSKFKNIVGVDIAGIQQWKFRKLSSDTLNNLIEDSIRIFGVKKIIVGSNWPVDPSFAKKTKTNITDKEVYDNDFNYICFKMGLNNKDICDIFRNNAIRIYNLDMNIKYL